MTNGYFGAERRKVVEAASLHQSPWILPGFAVMVEGIFFTALVMSYFGEDKTLLNVMCTAAVAQAGIVANFFFGSSQGSAKKDDALTTAAVKANETIAEQGKALAASTPAGNMTATLNPGPPPSVDITTGTEPKSEEEKKP